MKKNRESHKNKIGLLPYTRENISGLSPYVSKFYGWEISKFDIPKLWKESNGEGVRIAVIDTGCDLYHNDIKDNLLPGKNFVEKNKDPIDHNGHGTHVAGTIAAQDNEYGMVGVAPMSKIIPVKALSDDGSGSIQDIIEAIIWSADQGVDFITMSLGCPQTTNGLYNAIKYAVSKNIVIFCAAGNSGPNVDLMYPAQYEDVISIGAIDKNLERTSFTCSGESLDFLAPGQDIISCVPGNGYATMSGTSMSNPFAVGCAALVSSYRKKNNLNAFTSSQEYLGYFKKKAKSLTDPMFAKKKRYEGFGIITPYLST